MLKDLVDKVENMHKDNEEFQQEMKTVKVKWNIRNNNFKNQDKIVMKNASNTFKSISHRLEDRPYDITWKKE